MKKELNSLTIFLSLFCVFSCVKETQNNLVIREEDREEEFIPGTMLLKFDDSTLEGIEKQASTKSGPMTKTGCQAIDAIFDYLEVSSLERTFPDGGKWEARQRKAGLHRYYYLKYNDRKAVTTKAGELLSSVEGIELAQPLPNYKPMSEPLFNDPYYSFQWHYENSGSSAKYKKGADINVLPVWKEFTGGSSDVIVAVIDGGVDMTNSDIAPVVIPSGPGGSYNFIDGKSQISAHEHGTHVAGTVAAINNNGLGVCGVAGGSDGSGGVRILNCQVFNNELKYGVGFAKALVYAANNGAVIAQNSWGTDYKTEADALRGYISDDVKAAVDYFIENAGIGEDGTQTGPMKGGVVFFAAGNDNYSIGWPAAYEKVIAVGSFGSTGRKASYSNYGSWVDIAAPGGDVDVGPAIYSTIPGGYGYLQGTSMACPHASGVAALLVSWFGDVGFTNDMLVERILGGANPDFLPSDSQIGPMLDAYGAFCYGSQMPPARVDNYEVEGRGGSIALNWTVGADEEGKAAYAYLLMAAESEDAFTDVNLAKLPASIKRAVVLVEDLAVGAEISGFIDNLDFEHEYYVALSGYDYGKSFAPLSDIKKVKTTKNSAPQIEALTPAPWTARASQNFSTKIKVSDPDNHTVTVNFLPDSRLQSASSKDNSDGTYTLSVNSVQEEPGDYTITYQATDAFGASTKQDFILTILENAAPELLKDFENQVFEKKGESVTFKVSDFFRDPDADVLSFSVTHTNPKVAHLIALGDEFTLTTIGFGLDEITVKANDAKGASASTTFKVSVRDPESEADIYPTQVKDVLYVSGGAEAQTEIAIYSSVGAKVYESVQTTSMFEPAVIDCKSYAPGIYTVKVKMSGIQTQRTIVKL